VVDAAAAVAVAVAVAVAADVLPVAVAVAKADRPRPTSTTTSRSDRSIGRPATRLTRRRERVARRAPNRAEAGWPRRLSMALLECR